MVDNREDLFPKNNAALIKSLCDRRFGIGADGLVLLENDNSADFKMVYYNADGNQSSMCGNGGRCIAAFARKLGIIESQASFRAADGMHHASISEDGTVSLQMKDVDGVKIEKDYVFLDTGSPHHVQLVGGLKNFPVKEKGSEIRYGKLYGPGGANVNFVYQNGTDTFSVRTYERGVEDETLSCGTGATAAAIAMRALGIAASSHIKLHVEGGELEVSFSEKDGKYADVLLKGPATFVFKGTVEL